MDGLTITNYKDGSLTVSKTVSGNRGDPDKEFHFTVTLTENSSAGTVADSITKAFTITGDTDGATQLQFTNGKSVEFTLKHNESLTIQGLPAGIDYQVTEAERDQDGYTTSGTAGMGLYRPAAPRKPSSTTTATTAAEAGEMMTGSTLRPEALGGQGAKRSQAA